jgi:hypothetical protein
MALNAQIFYSIQKKATREINAKYNSKMEKTPQAYSQMKRNSNQPRQSHYYFYFYLKTKQTLANYAIRAAKKTEDV